MSNVTDDKVKLSKVDGLKHLIKLREEFTDFYSRIAEVFSTEQTVSELMAQRRYTSDEMREVLKELKPIKNSVLSDMELIAQLSSYSTSSQWGLTTRNGNYLLADRYVLPIRDSRGLVTALVGWLPDERKYVTTPTYGFARDAQFFNIEECRKYLGTSEPVYLVEGIFDTLALRSLGLFSLGNMGLSLSPVKREILTRFGHVYAIPDNDAPGRSVLPYRDMDTPSKNGKWWIDNVTYVELKVDGMKDMDDLVRFFDCKEDLLGLGDNYIAQIKETV